MSNISRTVITMKTLCVATTAFIMLVLGVVVYFWVTSVHLFAIDEFQFDDPNQRQIEFFLEYCSMEELHLENADYLLVSKSPHRSDSMMAIVFDGDVADWWDGFVNYPEGHIIRLPNHNTLYYTAEKCISTFVWAYRVPVSDGMKSVLRVTNVPGETIDQVLKLRSIS